MKKLLISASVAAVGTLAAAFIHFQGGASSPPPVPAPAIVQPETALAPLAAVKKEGPADSKPTSDTLIDHKATVFHVLGESQIMKNGSTEWRVIVSGDLVEEKDKIQTGKDSFVEVSYDEFYLNTARVGAESLAEFYSIEPTQVYLRQGEMFNTLDGLPENMQYDVGTNLAVAAIRGTRFVRKFDKVYFADSTFVASGVVEVRLGDAGGEAPVKTFRVEPNQALSFNADEVKTDLAKIDVKELSLEEMDQMNSIFGQLDTNLAEFKGGPDQLKSARDKWKTLMADGKEMEAFQNKARIASVSQKYDSAASWRKKADDESNPAAEALAEAEAHLVAATEAAAEFDASQGTGTAEEAAVETLTESDGDKYATVDELIAKNKGLIDSDGKVWESAVNVCEQRPEACPEDMKEEFCKRFPASPACSGMAEAY